MLTVQNSRWKMRNNRKPNRCKLHNYSSVGDYFVTVCIDNQESRIADLIDSEIVLNDYGQIVKLYWEQIPDHYEKVKMADYVIMPDHIHGIIRIGTGAQSISAMAGKQERYGLLSKIVKSFKECVTKEICKQYDDCKFKWKRSFHDRIIRNESEFGDS